VIDLRIDPDEGAFVAIFGQKGRGKSELAKAFFLPYPYDRGLIDSNSDVDPLNQFTAPYRGRLPQPRDGLWPSVRYEPDYTLGDKAWRAGVDQFVAQIYALGDPRADDPRPACLWVDEIGEIAKAGLTPPHLHQALHKGRHHRLTLIMSGPRPVDIDPLVLAQADLVCVFALRHELDRTRLAGSLGLSLAETEALLDNLDDFYFLAFKASTGELAVMPPIELANVLAIDRQRAGLLAA
jgi:hypothetical protein